LSKDFQTAVFCVENNPRGYLWAESGFSLKKTHNPHPGVKTVARRRPPQPCGATPRTSRQRRANGMVVHQWRNRRSDCFV